jgi:hypothetical protein
MKLVIDVKDSKAKLLLEFLQTLTYVKVERVPTDNGDGPDEKAAILANVQEAVNEMKLVKAGKLKGRDAMDFLNEL